MVIGCYLHMMAGIISLLRCTLISSLFFVTNRSFSVASGQTFVDLFDGNFQIPGGISNVPVSNFDDAAVSSDFLSFINSIPMDLNDAVPSRCRSPIDRGTGSGFSIRWGYDVQRGTCVKFIYSGRSRNENNFRTRSLCQSSCSNRCYQNVDSGSCGADIQRWGFNAFAGRCQSFSFGGCFGNTNNFGSERECVESCGDICLLPIIRGPGPSRLPRWGFNFFTGTCQEFFYGGSLGNRNRFLTLEQCEQACRPDEFPECPIIDPSRISVGPFGIGCNVVVAPLVPCPPEGCGEGFACCESGCGSMCVQLVDPPTMPCTQPIQPGNCNAQIPRFGFDPALGTCRLFTFTGCNGNDNNYETFVECLAACVPDFCLESLEHGPCYLRVIRWGYDPEISDCRSFEYGGCRGNMNNFNSPTECRASCLRGLPPGDPCEQPVDGGPCDDAVIRYSFNADLGFCLAFSYSGCGGNENNFFSLAACDGFCPPLVPMSVCELPAVYGDCTASLERWAFDSTTSECVRFTYSGCGGNGNNFPSQANCQLRCQAQNLCPDGNPPCVNDACVGATCPAFPDAICTVDLCDPTRACLPVWLDNLGNPVDCTQGVDPCEQPIVPGICFQQIFTWGYNSMANQCEGFVYSGCQGNQNSFISYDLCAQRCIGPIINRCAQPVSVGTCDESVPRWGYIAQTDSCSRFTYTGCNGNGNSFGQLADCVDTCVQDPASLCNQVVDPGPCSQQLMRYAFNTITNQCEPFIYGGCEGNSNNFETLNDCARTCNILIPPCAQPLDAGTCSGQQLSWGFNAGSGMCELFEFSLCPQFANMFATFEICSQTCSAPMERCNLPILVGSCTSNIQRWGYNTATLQCQTFQYTGCGGNANSFASQAECDQACDVIPVSDVQCSLPVVQGPCNIFVARFAFDAASQSCQPFTFGGCEGNANNFVSQAACEDRCLTDVCAQPITTCPGPLIRWGYDQSLGVCVSFSYGNCQASGNFFASQNECFLRCLVPRCSQAIQAGLCSAELSSFYFNSQTNQCEMFTYSGCGGTANRFNNLQECQQYCEAPVCDQPEDSGPCSLTITQFSYNPVAQSCQQFSYGGCLGSLNRFETLAQCQTTCQAPPPGPDVCSQPIDAGPCDQNLGRFGYNSLTESCEFFTYGGCGGNGNNFATVDLCNQRCVVDACAQPLDTSCPGIETRWGYNSAQQSCVSYSYGGCVTNANQFASQAECRARCETPICLQAIEAGTCSSALTRFGYNTQTGQCQSFIYTGCGGNANRFSTLATCQQFCETNMCNQPQDAGPCTASFTSFSYDPFTQTCQQFSYGGCLGTSNRFDTIEQCQTTCQIAPVAEVCALPIETGPCNDFGIRFAYNPFVEGCQQFVYGGCMGNQNNFESMAACTQRCVTDVCAQPITTCPGADTRWAYDAAQGRCISFSYGGCVTSGNFFESELDCQLRCGIPLCSQDISVGPCTAQITRFAYNAEMGHCEEFTYGGCSGTANRFSTLLECQQRCEADTCAQPIDVGPCSQSIARFRYNPFTSQCDSIQYSGCLGSANIFETVEDCLTRCNVDLCSLPFDFGSCSFFSTVWHYNPTSGNCEGRTYSGCLGNPNRFSSQAECEARCTGNVCFQVRDPGPCSANLQSFGFNALTESCEQFTYGGCLGGGNRFDTIGQCQTQCEIGNVCAQAIEVGSGTDAIERFGYNPQTGSCTSFTYTGAGANLNNFATLELCNQRCVVDVCAQQITSCPGAETSFAFDVAAGDCVPISYGGCVTTGNFFDSLQGCRQRCTAPVCSQAIAQGGCSGQLQRFAFNPSSGQCQSFTYSGCGGTANRFSTLVECQQNCEADTCTQPQNAGPCTQSNQLRFAFSPATGSCVSFFFSGCLGNSNAFVTINDCQARCNVDVCSLQFDAGACTAFSTVWAFDSNSGVCQSFAYGGCLGNPNRFSTQASCQARCEADVCSQPEDPGPCSASITRFSFDPNVDSCSSFTYGGCLGGGNNFVSLTQCQTTCEAVVDVCAQPIDRGPCNGNIQQFAFDPSSQACVTFSYGGCGGNANRFASQDVCDQRCLVDVCAQPPSTCTGQATRWRFSPATGTCTSFQTSADCTESGNFFQSQMECQQRCTETPCFQAIDAGTCSASIPRFTYNLVTGQCQSLIYSGCGGTANRFTSLADCEQRCEAELCARPIDQGPCTTPQTRFTYDPTMAQCRSFTYSGCLGNTNMFMSMAQCQERCEADVCALPRDTGEPCFQFSTVWSYSASTGTCTSFTYSGCGGNPNRFASQQACEARCIADTCTQAQEAGPCSLAAPRFRFNEATQTCDQFSYGGCFGSANTFTSQQACMDRCIANTCSLPVDSGACTADSSLFGFNTVTNQCEQFTYTGCLGNPNRFSTLGACQARCEVQACNQPLDPGPCSLTLQVFGYNPTSGNCESFNFGGCLGGVNRYNTIADCQATCDAGNNVPSCPIPTQAIEGETCGIIFCLVNSNCQTDGRTQLCCPGGCPGGAIGQNCLEPLNVALKAGTCPDPPAVDPVVCTRLCEQDSECSGTAKCCYTGCGTSCMEPA